MVGVRAALDRWGTGVYSWRISLIRRNGCGILRIPENGITAREKRRNSSGCNERRESWMGSLPGLGRNVVLFRDSGPKNQLKERAHEDCEIAVLEAWARRQHRADRSFYRWRARADHFGPDQTGVVADPDDHVDAGDAAAGRGGKNCGYSGGSAVADAVYYGRCGGQADVVDGEVVRCVDDDAH